jgi:hypothetical protein
MGRIHIVLCQPGPAYVGELSIDGQAHVVRAQHMLYLSREKNFFFYDVRKTLDMNA